MIDLFLLKKCNFPYKENEEVWSSPFHENCCGDGGVNDSINDTIIINNPQNTN